MKVHRFIIVKLTYFLILGICIGYYTQIPLLWCFSLSFIALLTLFILYLTERNNFSKSTYFGILAFLLTTSIGITALRIHNQRIYKQHYSNYNNPIQTVTLQIQEKLKPSRYYNRYEARVLALNHETCSGKILLNINKDSLKESPHVDDIYITSSALKPISEALNPGQFNYKTYLERKNIFAQISTYSNSLYKISPDKTSVYGIADRLVTFLTSQLKQAQFGQEELSVITALLLGQRQDVSDVLYDNYAKAGVVHILAVSGLHVGILLLLIHFILSPLHSLKYGKLPKLITTLILLWGFAFLTGLSPSVTRATTMFSLIAIALNWNRKTNIYNTIAISAFILLLSNPMYLFDVGFQLSYLAVLSIVTIQPKLYALWIPKYSIIKFLWSTLTVTIAAQIGVLPLSLFYFHQFPGLFFITNLIVVPFLSLLLGLGLLVLILAGFQILPSVLGQLYNGLIKSLNVFINWAAQQNYFIFDNISIQFNTLIAMYFCISCIILFSIKPRFKSAVFLLLSFIGIQTSLIYNSITKGKTEWVIFHKTRNTLITKNTHNTLEVHSNITSDSLKTDYNLKNYSLQKNSKQLLYSKLASAYNIKSHTLFVIDSTNIYNVQTITPEYILLRNSPKINLNRVIDSLKPKLIIADGSNYKSYIKRWKVTCEIKKLPFHNTGEKGAFIFN
ncbi:ComEC/Rec2 family competence protein [Formosa sp. S-31]|uniref:ComEC/Rec2 family competence protein n=1 Tax=Formosa sp. S-31 TaxID=2790949 RepID=UPI003EBAA5F0